MTSIRAKAPSPLVLQRPALLSVDDDDGRRNSYSTVSTRTTGLSNTTMLTSPPDTPRTFASSPSLGDGPSESRKKSKDSRLGKMKSSSFLGFLSVKEPSLQALERYEQAQRREMEVAARETGRPLNAGLSGVSRTKMPASVPKVNSKWDGLPKTARAEERNGNGAEHDDAGSVRSDPWSRMGPPSPANPLGSGSGSSSSDQLEFSLQLSRGYNQTRRRASLFSTGTAVASHPHRPPQSAHGSSTSSLLDFRSTRSRPISIQSQPPMPPLPDHVRARSSSSAHSSSIRSPPITPIGYTSSPGPRPTSFHHSGLGPPSSVHTRSIRSTSSSSSKPFVVVEEDVDHPMVPPLVTMLAPEDEYEGDDTDDDDNNDKDDDEKDKDGGGGQHVRPWTGPSLERTASMPSLVPPAPDPSKPGLPISTITITGVRPTTATGPQPQLGSKPSSNAPPPLRSILVSNKPARSSADGRGSSPAVSVSSSGLKTLLRRIKVLNGAR